MNILPMYRVPPWTMPGGRQMLGQVLGCLLGQAGPGFDLQGPTRSLLAWSGMSHVKGKCHQSSRQGWG